MEIYSSEKLSSFWLDFAILSCVAYYYDIALPLLYLFLATLASEKLSTFVIFLDHYGYLTKHSDRMAAPLAGLGLCPHYNVGCPCRRACPLRPRYVADQGLLYKIPPPVEEVADINHVFGEYIPLSTLFLEEYEEKRIAKFLRPDRFPVLSWATKAFAGRTAEGD